jgi:DNA mismatch repair protein MutL
MQVQPGQTRDQRLSAVWGPDIADSLIPVQHAAGAFRVEGLIQRPGEARPTGRRTQLLINGRPFRDHFLVRAAEAGYRSAIHPGDRPSLFLAVEVDPDQVDVNVHPAKLEVRFRDRLGLERVVEDAVRQALGELQSAVRLETWAPAPVGSEVDATTLFDLGDDGAAPAAQASPEEADDDPATEMRAQADGTPLFSLFDTYILYQGREGIVIVDQHAAHERVIYEDVMAQLGGAEAPAQHLLLPLTVDLTDEELEVLDQHAGQFRDLGFEVEPFGGRTVKLTTVPSPHPRFDAMACFREMVADLARGRFGGWANQLERFAATFACRAAVKAGQTLDEREMRELLRRLFSTKLPPHDVHGRATMVQLSREELERRFGRR